MDDIQAHENARCRRHGPGAKDKQANQAVGDSEYSTTADSAPLAYTIWPGLSGGAKVDTAMPWADLCKMIWHEPARPAKTQCRLLKLATFGDHRTGKGSLRHDANLLTVTGIEGDHDAGTMTPDEAIEILERHHVRALVYTSWSHTTDKPRWRVLCPLSRPVAPDERLPLVEALNGLLGGALAHESATLSQSYYFGWPDGAERTTLVTFDDPDDGYCLDELDTWQQYRRPFDATGKAPGNGAGNAAGEPAGERKTPDDHLTELLSGEDVHGAARRIIGRMVREGLSDSIIRVVFEGLAPQVAEARGVERAADLMGDELTRMIQGARLKGYGADRRAERDAHGDEATAGDDKAQALTVAECERLVAYLWRSGRHAPECKWPRVSLGTGSYTAPWLAIATKHGADGYERGVDAYLPRRVAEVDRKNAERVARGAPPDMDMPEGEIRSHAIAWAARIRGMAVTEADGRALLARAAPARTLGFVRAGELLQQPPPLRWLIRRYLVPDCLAVIFGAPKTGKSLVALAWSVAIACGLDWCGNRTTAGPVIYLAGEGHFGIRRRLKALGLRLGIEARIDAAPLVVSRRGARLTDPAALEATADEIDGLAAELGAPALIVVDTLNRNFGPGDENATADMSAFVAALDFLRERYAPATVLVVHHSGHGAQDRGRGSSVLLAAIDLEYAVAVESGPGDRTLRPTATKDIPPPPAVTFELEQVQLPWLDDEGEPETSVVLSETQGTGTARRSATPTQRLAFGALLDAIDASGFAPPDEIAETLPDGARLVGLEGWRREFYAVHMGDTPASKRQAFHRAREGLATLGAIGHRDDAYWVTPLCGGVADLHGMVAARAVARDLREARHAA